MMRSRFVVSWSAQVKVMTRASLRLSSSMLVCHGIPLVFVSRES